MGMDQYLLIPFLGGWTSIYQLFWCSPGVQGFDTLPYFNFPVLSFGVLKFGSHWSLRPGSQSWMWTCLWWNKRWSHPSKIDPNFRNNYRVNLMSTSILTPKKTGSHVLGATDQFLFHFGAIKPKTSGFGASLWAIDLTLNNLSNAIMDILCIYTSWATISIYCWYILVLLSSIHFLIRLQVVCISDIDHIISCNLGIPTNIHQVASRWKLEYRDLLRFNYHLFSSYPHYSTIIASLECIYIYIHIYNI